MFDMDFDAWNVKIGSEGKRKPLRRRTSKRKVNRALRKPIKKRKTYSYVKPKSKPLYSAKAEYMKKQNQFRMAQQEAKYRKKLKEEYPSQISLAKDKVKSFLRERKSIYRK